MRSTLAAKWDLRVMCYASEHSCQRIWLLDYDAAEYRIVKEKCGAAVGSCTVFGRDQLC